MPAYPRGQRATITCLPPPAGGSAPGFSPAMASGMPASGASPGSPRFQLLATMASAEAADARRCGPLRAGSSAAGTEGGRPGGATGIQTVNAVPLPGRLRTRI